jgi:PleD family two-component response regulator
LSVVTAGGTTACVDHHCTASIGVVIFSSDDGSQDDILKWADAAMYDAKQSGRNGIRFYGAAGPIT